MKEGHGRGRLSPKGGLATGTMLGADHLVTIRVVNAFRHGVDGTQLQQASNNPNVQRVLQRQASLNKRLSTCSNISDDKKGATDKKEANNDVNNKANNSASHTETAV